MGKFEYTMGKEVDLRAEWEKTLEDPGLRSNIILRAMYAAMDLIYGKGRELEKFMVIELLARYPYWAWETGSYLRLSRQYTNRIRIWPGITLKWDAGPRTTSSGTFLFWMN